MSGTLVHIVLTTGFLLLAPPITEGTPEGSEPAPVIEQISPMEVPPADITLDLGNYRRNRYDVWQNYGVDRQGHFRPRVIYSPYGAYYARDGQPYPWVSTHMRDFMPYVVD